MDFFKVFKKVGKRLQLVSNKIQGKLGEDTYYVGAITQGKEVKRTGIGHDFKERTVDFITGKKGSWKYKEVKTGRSKLSSKQKASKKKLGKKLRL